MRLAIVGCRPPPAHRFSTSFAEEWAIYGRILEDVTRFFHIRAVSHMALCGGTKGFEIVSGGARGVDSLAENLAKDLGCVVVVHHADWKGLGKAAGFARNTTIVDDSDEVHAWPAPWSRGTWDTIKKGRAFAKPTFVHDAVWKGLWP